ncbi:NAD-dependent epimerase/dehydratase family protein [[Micrococcus luteus] ATCC 49442]|uniref:NAD-dependent epimerase/dehydratase family protein n=1 Tax=[Micrococcus luteus] ATCC 49442 TaxID=2698727 RepID=UPI0013DA89FD
MRILVTGANGFLGQHVCERLLKDQHNVGASVRRQGTAPVGTLEFVVGDLGKDVNWDDSLQNVDAVIHLAARVHVMDDQTSDPAAEYQRVNVDATHKLALRARELGVKRFVFMSTIAVNGSRTGANPFDVHSEPQPSGYYGTSKWEAEQSLATLSAEGPMSVISVRAPMVYGPDAPGNTRRLVQLAKTGLPVPLASVNNKRTLISVRNLADLLATCATEAGLGSGLVVAADDYSPSTAELFREISVSLGRRPRIWRLPVSILSALGSAVGRGRDVSRLVDSLEVKNSTTVSGLAWTPIVPFQEAVHELGMHAAGRFGA